MIQFEYIVLPVHWIYLPTPPFYLLKRKTGAGATLLFPVATVRLGVALLQERKSVVMAIPKEA